MMAACFTVPSRLTAVGGLGVLLLTAACGSEAGPDAAAAPQSAQAPTAAEYAAALEPKALLLESLGCYRAVNAAAVDLVRERLSPELAASLSNPRPVRLLTLTTKAHTLEIPGEEQQAAHSAGRSAPMRSEPGLADYEDYLRRCLAVLERAESIEVG